MPRWTCVRGVLTACGVRLAGPALLAVAAFTSACSSSTGAANRPVLAAPPPRDDGKPAEGGKGGDEHAAALEQLKLGSLDGRVDKQNSIRVPLPDAEHWTRVRFW